MRHYTKIASLSKVVTSDLFPAIAGVLAIDVDGMRGFKPVHARPVFLSQLAEELTLLRGFGEAIQMHGALHGAND